MSPPRWSATNTCASFCPHLHSRLHYLLAASIGFELLCPIVLVFLSWISPPMRESAHACGLLLVQAPGTGPTRAVQHWGTLLVFEEGSYLFFSWISPPMRESAHACGLLLVQAPGTGPTRAVQHW